MPMLLPCPACGFLTNEGDFYGTYNICGICGWEDDSVQLANPGCGGGANGESLIDAQRRALALHPLAQVQCDGIQRDAHWRPLNQDEIQAAGTDWKNSAIGRPSEVYWNRFV